MMENPSHHITSGSLYAMLCHATSLTSVRSNLTYTDAAA
jgi:hypothetical protein